MSGAHFLLGLAFALLGGVVQGAMLWPMKLTEKWSWENLWLEFTVVAFLLAPWGLAFLTVPRLLQALAEVGPGTFARTLLFGVGWGVGTVLFGIGIAILGLGLGYVIIMGLTVSVGTLVPLLALNPGEVSSRRGLGLIAGVATIIVGTWLCSYAGKLREERLGIAAPQRGAMLRRSYRMGVLVCVLAGFLIPCGNLALSFGSEIPRRAEALGASALNSVNALWAVVTFPLFLCSSIYCLALLRRNRTFGKFLQPGTASHWGLAAGMGVAQMAGIALYGFGAASLGRLGTSVGFAILMSSMIVAANLLGLLSGEWKGAGTQPGRYMVVGLLMLTGAIFLISYGNRPGI